MPRAFAPEEYQDRWQRARAAMAEAGVDGLFLTTRENVLYMCGMETNAWYGSPIVFVLPLAAPPVLAIPLHEVGNAEAEAYCPDIRAWGSFDPAAREGVDPARFVADLIGGLGLARGRLATERRGRSGLAPEFQKRLWGWLDGAAPVAADPVLAKVRAIKSPVEIALIRRACQVTCAGYRAGLEALREGVTEDEVARLMWETMVREGCDLGDHAGHIILRGGPERNRCFGAVPSHKRLVRGDIIKIDGGARVNAYCCDMARYGGIGEPTPEQRRMYEADEAAGAAAASALRPGATLGQVFDAAVRVLRDYGYEELALTRSDTIFGHSIGMHMHEPPRVAAGSDEVVRPDMVFALEPQLNAHPPDFRLAVFSVEDMVLVTEAGPEILTPVPRALRVAV
jgi:Xaa-Pro dipeptidase